MHHRFAPLLAFLLLALASSSAVFAAVTFCAVITRIADAENVTRALGSHLPIGHTYDPLKFWITTPIQRATVQSRGIAQ